MAHSTGSIIKDRKPDLFRDKDNLLDADILERAKEIAKDLYGFGGEGKRDLTDLEMYLMADSYVIARGRLVEREVLQSREGYYKASMVVMAILSLVLICAGVFGGVAVQFGPKSVATLSRVATLSSGLVGVILTLVFRRSFRFFNRVKVNNTILLFMALWSLGKDYEQRGS